MELSELRKKLNKIDDEMAALFKERMDTVLEVAKLKEKTDLPVYDRARERDILSRVTDITGKEYESYTKILYSTLFDVSRSYQSKNLMKPTELTQSIISATSNNIAAFPTKATVACQGIEGSYSQQACDKIFSIPSIMYFNRFEGVFQAVESGMCNYGILPIENSSAGSVTAVYNLMKKHNFYIVRSIKLKVEHSLLAKKGTDIKNIKEIVSHEQALRQCSEFLSKHPQIKTTVFENTAQAASYVASCDRNDIAALASPLCAELYGLETLDSCVQNSSHNYTRFICISKKLEIYPGAGKLSFMLSLPHRPGSLYQLMAKFSALGLNLTKLESQPIPDKDFEFMFYFDLEAVPNSPDIISLISEMQHEYNAFVFLGCYSEVF